MPEVNAAAVADRDRLEAELVDVEVKLSRLRTPALERLSACRAELLRSLRTVQRAAQPRAKAIDAYVSETSVEDMYRSATSRRPCLDPAGIGVLFSAGLAAAEVEVRLSVVWPPLLHARLEDFLEPIGGGYRRQIVPPGRWKVSVAEGSLLVEGPPVEFEFTRKLDDGVSVLGAVIVVSNRLLWAQRFFEAFRPVGGGNLSSVVEVQPWFHTAVSEERT